MQVRATIGFVSTLDGKKYRVQAGDVVEMPAGADWVQAGLCVVVGDVEERVLVAPEKAVKRTTTTKRSKKVKD